MATAQTVETEIQPLLVEPAEQYEVVDGRVVEEPPWSVQQSWIASGLIEVLGQFARSNRLGRVVHEALFILRRSPSLKRRPDVSFVSIERWAFNRPLTRENAWDVIPDLAVEIIDPTDPSEDLMNKVEEYFEAGVRLVWAIYPDHRKVYVYQSPSAVQILQVGDELEGESVVPGFRLAVSSLFNPDKIEPQTSPG